MLAMVAQLVEEVEGGPLPPGAVKLKLQLNGAPIGHQGRPEGLIRKAIVVRHDSPGRVLALEGLENPGVVHVVQDERDPPLIDAPRLVRMEDLDHQAIGVHAGEPGLRQLLSPG